MSRTITSATGILAQFRTSVQKAGGKCTKYPHCIGEEIKSVITKCFAMRPGDVKIKRKKRSRHYLKLRFSGANKISGLLCNWRGIVCKEAPKVICVIPMPQSGVISWMYFF